MDDAPKLFLETSLPTSASPYPSPSSAFYPPPIPASHEFANKLAANKRYRGSGGAASVTSPNVNGTLSPSSATSSRRGSTSAPSPLSQQANSPTTPQPQPLPAQEPTVESKPLHDRNSAGLSLGTLPPNTLTAPTSIPITPITQGPPSTPGTTPSKRTSQIIEALTPIRAAPPSPAPSRRGSLIRRGSSRRWSGAGGHGGESASSSMVSEDGSTDGHDPATIVSKRASRRLSAFNALSALGMTTEGQVANFSVPSAPSSTRGEATDDAKPGTEKNQPDSLEAGTAAAKPILVADFGFPEDDVRFSKRPLELLTREERVALRPEDQQEPKSQEDPDEWDEGPEDEWSTAWLASGRRISGEEMTPRFGSGFDDRPADDSAGGTGGGTQADPDAPLPAGIYRALYAFEAEGTAEMSLDEGQFVRVVGRGGGVGWAVVERGWSMDADGQEKSAPPAEEAMEAGDEGSGALGLAGQALVPEGYLEIWRLDGEEW